MDPNSSIQLTHDFPPFFKVYRGGTIQRYMVTDHVPTGLDPNTGVQSKDVAVSSETGVMARLFMPKIYGPDQKLPLVVHYHGGGFCLGSPFGTIVKNLLSSLVHKANVIAISVDYRLAPESPLPIAFEDSYAALQWIGSHSSGQGPEAWLNEHADLGRIFLAGESAGANIAHYVAVQAGINDPMGLNILRLLSVHPYFGEKEPSKMYKFMCPTSSGCDDDPKLNPGVDPNLSKMACGKVLVCVAEKDSLRDRGVRYHETLEESRWDGLVELFETKGEDHCFHLFSPSVSAGHLLQKMVDFIVVV